MEFLNDQEGGLNECQEEVDAIVVAKKNLTQEKTALLEKAQDLEEKYVDLRTRHDTKTDMVGKLSVKVFILMTEIEKLTNKD